MTGWFRSTARTAASVLRSAQSRPLRTPSARYWAIASKVQSGKSVFSVDSAAQAFQVRRAFPALRAGRARPERQVAAGRAIGTVEDDVGQPIPERGERAAQILEADDVSLIGVS